MWSQVDSGLCDTLLFSSLHLPVSQTNEKEAAGAQYSVCSNHIIFIFLSFGNLFLQVQEAIIPSICLCITLLII